MEVKRICIYPKDIQRITGKSERYGRLLLAKIKDRNKKEEHQFVTVDEFCRYTGLKLIRLPRLLRDSPSCMAEVWIMHTKVLHNV